MNIFKPKAQRGNTDARTADKRSRVHGAQPVKTPDKQYLFDKPRNIKRLLLWFYVLCALLYAVDFIYHRHVIHAWESMPSFYAWYGFIACVLLVVVAKQLRRILMRAPGYYADDGDDGDGRSAENIRRHGNRGNMHRDNRRPRMNRRRRTNSTQAVHRKPDKP